jgi:hemerythrin-like metal-binding protein
MFDDSPGDTPTLPLVLLVDDERFTHGLVAEALKGHCELMSAGDGADAVMAIESRLPDLIIMDVEMPGITGLDLCRALRESAATANTPIIFLSGHDEIVDRVAGYSAGGDDYVVKPFSMRELHAKTMNMLESFQLLRETRSTAEFATSTAMTAMSNMGELSVLLEALKAINTAREYRKIAEAVVAAINDFSLQGAVQLRVPGQEITLNCHGEASLVEVAVIAQMVDLDRIFQFGKRLLITYDRVSLLISNLPIDDPDRIGRLRDHLAMLTEGADVRVQAIVSARESKQRGDTIGQTLTDISDALKEIDIAQRNSRMATNLAVSAMSENIGHALLSVALTEAQEDYLTGIIRAGVDNILDAHSGELNVQDRLSRVIRDLKAACGDEQAEGHAPRLVWSDLFSVGNELIDEDHKILINRMNQLHAAVLTCGHEQIRQALTALDQHARAHFAREETLMEKSSFPDEAIHRDAHLHLLHALEMHTGKILGGKAGQAEEIFQTLKNWVQEHIVTLDRSLATHLASKHGR